MIFRRVLSLVVIAVFSANAALAQIAAELKGRVVDASGANVAQAEVDLTELATSIVERTVSSSSGDYLFSHLHGGLYRIDVNAKGFEHLTRTGVTAIVGQTVTADLMMAIGSDQQTVTVTEDAPLLQTSESDIETHLPGRTVLALPLNSRNFINLAALAPGVALPPGTVLPRINGGRPRTNEYLFDGISALQPEPGQVAFFPHRRRYSGVHH